MIDRTSSIPMPSIAGTIGQGPLVPGTTTFEEVLAQKQGDDQRATIRDESRKLVAEAFIAPLLAKIREQNQAAAPFGPTDAEKRFGPMFDRAVADSMTDPERFPMVRAVERSMLERLDALGTGGA